MPGEHTFYSGSKALAPLTDLFNLRIDQVSSDTVYLKQVVVQVFILFFIFHQKIYFACSAVVISDFR